MNKPSQDKVDLVALKSKLKDLVAKGVTEAQLRRAMSKSELMAMLVLSKS